MNIKNFFSYTILNNIREYTRTHKKTSIVIGIVIIGAGYWSYKKLTNASSETRYVTASVERGTIISSISGTGQVSASNQIDIKSKAGGDVVYVGVTNGQSVSAGTLVAQLDTRDAQKAVRDATVNLESAQIALQKLQAPADTLSTLQTENALAQAKTDLQKSYDDGFNTVSNAFLDLPSVMTGMQDVMYGTELTHGNQDNVSAYNDLVKNNFEQVSVFRDDAVTKYNRARTAYDKAIIDYKNASRQDDPAKIVALIEETYTTTKIIADSIKSTNDLLNYVKDRLTEKNQNIPSLLSTHQTQLNTYTNETNSHLLNLLNIKNSITSGTFAINEKTESLAKLKRGADPLDITSQNLSITQRENALIDAKANLQDYYIRVPFDGVLAKVSVKKLDTIGSGTSVATLITTQKVAEISLNEVDVSKVKVGQKATLTFDAIPDLTITGLVAEIDSIGTVSQGVVTYNVKITFDTQDDRIKPGMSISSSIITDVRQDVLVVANSAIKLQNNTSYVEIFDPALVGSDSSQGVVSPIAPIKQTVETGLSNDTETEIVSGLKEKDQVVIKTINPTTATANSTTPSLFGSAGGNRTGSTVRMTGGR